MRTNKDMVELQIMRADESLIKGKDLGLFNKVTGFLQSRGLNFKLVGSVAENAREGRPRQGYTDIDILVSHRESDEFKNAYMDLARTFNEVPGFNEPLGAFITNYSDKENGYVDTGVDQRFTLQEDSTTIDLNFQSLTGARMDLGIAYSNVPGVRA